MPIVIICSFILSNSIIELSWSMELHVRTFLQQLCFCGTSWIQLLLDLVGYEILVTVQKHIVMGFIGQFL
jgi:hypothetical protein